MVDKIILLKTYFPHGLSGAKPWDSRKAMGEETGHESV
jgi:hypothetical protein